MSIGAPQDLCEATAPAAASYGAAATNRCTLQRTAAQPRYARST